MMGLGETLALSVLTFVFGVAWVFFIPFVIIYVLERNRAAKNGEQLGGLGAATLSSLMLTVCWQSLIAGIALFFAHVIEDLGEAAKDTAGGLFLGALIAAVMPAMLLRHALARKAGRVLRSALGINAAVTGLLAVAMTIGLCVGFFNDAEKLGMVAAVTFVYTVATVATARPLLAESSTLVGVEKTFE